MTIVEQSSKAQDRTLSVWYSTIEQGTIKLPRFQRMEVWDRNRIASLLTTIISNLPVGITLVLEVAEQEKFISRYISTAETKAPGFVTQHLLDGQQRLTAFWRTMHNNYEDETYFVYLPEFDETEDSLKDDEEKVYCQPRWPRKDGRRAPLWADDPEESLKRGLVPISLLRPGDMAREVDNWLVAATKRLEPDESAPDAFKRLKEHAAIKEKLKTRITTLRERVAHFNLPHLSLPFSTPKDVALQVFINMNTNSKPLSLYDLIVAEVEEVLEESLHSLQERLNDQHPEIARFQDLSYLILATSALLQEAPPNNRGMMEMDKKKMIGNWRTLDRSLTRLAAFLANQGIHDETRLPTNAVLAVIAACYAEIPETGDFLAKAEKLLKRYLWSSFFTDRYENAAATRAFSDFRALKVLLTKKTYTDAEIDSVPVLDRDEYPLVTAEGLVKLGWPKAMSIQARAVLAVTTHLGAVDFADGKTASYESLQHREYHHIFPDALLSDAGIDSYRALNCALLTWKTNRMIGRKDPIDYLKDRVEWADEPTVRQRLGTHLVPYEMLTGASYGDLQGDVLKAKLQPEFDAFLLARARLIEEAARRLSSGESVLVESFTRN